MHKTEIFFPFEPVPKGRPRFTRTGHAYTPKTTQDYEKKIAEYYRENCSDFYDIAIKVKIIFNMPIAKSITKKNRELIMTGIIKHTKKPDADNMTKSVTDALNGIAYADDSLITEIHVIKRYATDNNVGIELTIAEDVE